MHLHLKEMKYNTKSLNCYSCGAGLIKKIESNSCKCSYCKNTNIILEDGSTKIIEEVERKPKANKKEIPFWVYVLIPFCIIFFMKISSYKKNEKEKRILDKNRNIIII